MTAVRSQRSAGPVGGGGRPLVFFRSPKKNEGSRAPTGAGAEAAAPRDPPRGRVHLRIAGDDRLMTRAGAPLDALLRRSHYGVGPRFRRWCQACPSIVSQLLAGDHSVPGRSPNAARVRGCEPRARAPHQQARGFPQPAAEGLAPHLQRRLRPAPPSERLMMAPLDEQGADKINAVLSAGINYFRGVVPAMRQDPQKLRHARPCAGHPRLPCLTRTK
jgi:hypothetical protein